MSVSTFEGVMQNGVIRLHEWPALGCQVRVPTPPSGFGTLTCARSTPGNAGHSLPRVSQLPPPGFGRLWVARTAHAPDPGPCPYDAPRPGPPARLPRPP